MRTSPLSQASLTVKAPDFRSMEHGSSHASLTGRARGLLCRRDVESSHRRSNFDLKGIAGQTFQINNQVEIIALGFVRLRPSQGQTANLANIHTYFNGFLRASIRADAEFMSKNLILGYPQAGREIAHWHPRSPTTFQGLLL